MSRLHWLILFPYYFFGAFVLTTLFAILSRVLRLPLTIERLAGAGIVASVGLLVALFAVGTVGIGDFTLLPILGLIAASFLLAALDTLLKKPLPLSAEDGHDRRRPSDPQLL